VHDTVRHQDVGNRHTGAVHKDASFLANGDGEVVAAQCGKGSAILEARRVANRAFDNVVAQNIGEVLVRDVSKSRANVAERLVGWSKNGDVGRSVNRLDEVGLVEGTTQRAETGSGQSVRATAYRVTNSSYFTNFLFCVTENKKYLSLKLAFQTIPLQYFSLSLNL
jgi:hypothetical protein